jgi:hypothetical protein
MADVALKPVFVSTNAMDAEEVRCLLEGSGLMPLVLGAQTSWHGRLYGQSFGSATVVVPEDQLAAAADVLRAAGRPVADPDSVDMKALEKRQKDAVILLAAGVALLVGLGFLVRFALG